MPCEVLAGDFRPPGTPDPPVTGGGENPRAALKLPCPGFGDRRPGIESRPAVGVPARPGALRGAELVAEHLGPGVPKRRRAEPPSAHREGLVAPTRGGAVSGVLASLGPRLLSRPLPREPTAPRSTGCAGLQSLPGLELRTGGGEAQRKDAEQPAMLWAPGVPTVTAATAAAPETPGPLRPGDREAPLPRPLPPKKVGPPARAWPAEAGDAAPRGLNESRGLMGHATAPVDWEGEPSRGRRATFGGGTSAPMRLPGRLELAGGVPIE